MKTITDAVRDIVQHDDVALQAIHKGVLNMSAYAQHILPQVEEMTLKTVQKGSIVVALSRIVKEIEISTPLRPHIILDDLRIKSPLCVVTFHKTKNNREKIITLYQKFSLNENTFFTLTQSSSEITLIVSEASLSTILHHFNEEPKAQYTNQVAVSVRFAEKYLSVPNVLYTLQAALSVHNINITEIVSTYTEFCFIIEQKNLETVIQVLQEFFNG